MINNIQIFNTLSRKKEIFKPINKGVVGMYHCGPTVYDRIHIGNFRAFIVPDILRRMFEYNGYEVKQIMNITDVGHLVSDGDEGEDKMTKGLKREGKPITLEAMLELSSKYADQFLEDLKSLNIEPAQKYPRASEHIIEDIEIVKQLETKGFDYALDDGMYFDTAKFPSYGKLGNISIESLKEGARITTNSNKRNPADFVLWRFDPKIGWDSPWGKGFPGWHIECSAMSAKYLGQPFDIHTGGIDHIPVHHNNEIAQSEAAYDKPLANYWMHNEFLIIGGDKMSKSLGNYVTLETLKEEAISPLAYRYWSLTAHYRSPVNFTYEAVRGSQNALIKLMKTIVSYPKDGQIIPEYKEKFLTLINDDLNLPQAIALAWNLIADSNQKDADKRATLIDFDRVFGLKLDSIPETKEEVPPEIQALAETREEARKEKDWVKADAIRKEIENRGFTVKDTAEGIEIVRI
ncbi:MAG: cysteine--tRNA ligase [Candidatus Paceibacterota bacterium]